MRWREVSGLAAAERQDDMGVDLRLMPLMYDHESGPAWPHVQLELDRDSGLWDVIRRDLTVKSFGRELYQFDEETGLKKVTEDAYGDALTFATAGDLSALLVAWIVHPPIHGVSSWTRAASAYLAQLRPETTVVLWWH